MPKHKHAPKMHAPVHGKRASFPQDGQGEKVAVQHLGWAGERPSWRVKHMEMCDPYGWHQMGAAKGTEIIQKLGHFETMTWDEILVKAKDRNHAIPVFKICAKAQQRMQALGIETEDVISLRLQGEERIWGVMDAHVFQLLWWDPEHRICPSPKKHT